MKDNITFVTAYIQLPDSGKSWKGIQQNSSTYRRWMTPYSMMNNYLVAYMSDWDDCHFLQRERSKLDPSLTRIYHISKDNLWSFSLLPKITAIFKNESYPKHWPNTVKPLYPCAVNSKYEHLLRALRENPFQTKYFGWLDAGLYRSLIEEHKLKPFSLALPPGFNSSKVSYAAVKEFTKTPPEKVFYDNVDWISGAAFVGRADVMIRLVQDYLTAVKYFLSKGLMSADQQILNAMYQDENFKKQVDIQTYEGYYPALGYIMKNQAETAKMSKKV